MSTMRHARLAAGIGVCLAMLAAAGCGGGASPALKLDAGTGFVSAAASAPAPGQELPPSGSVRDAILKIQANPAGNGFTFVFMGDSRNKSPFGNEPHADAEGAGDEAYRKVVKAVNKLGASFAIHGGDFTFDNRKGKWQDVLAINKDLAVPLVTVIGNHETIFSRSFYEENFAAPNPGTGLGDFSFEHGGVRFIGLDNANLTITDQQFAWLAKQLDTPLRKVLLTHAPPKLGNWADHAMKGGAVSERFLKAMDTAQVDMVLLSHIHLYDDVKRGNTRYIVSGGAGAPFSKLNFGTKVHHAVLIQVPANGALTHRMIPVA